MHRTRKALIPVTIMLIFISLFPAIEGDGESSTYELDFPEIKVTKERITTWLGEGDFIGIRNQDRDAMIGVLFGTQENPNYIYIISVWTRYLGVGDVYDEDGKLLKKGHPIPVRTMFAQRFGNIFEFDDTDGDGIFDSRKKAGSSDENEAREPVFKRASLYTSWTPSEVSKKETGAGTKEWSFSLTATSIKYRKPFGVMQVDRDRSLDEVSLTFHLYVDVENESYGSVPFFKIGVAKTGANEYDVRSSELIEDRTYSGTKVDARFKYDHAITGWDLSSGNTSHSLMMSTRILFANAVSSEEGPWLKNDHEELLSGVKAGGCASFEDATGSCELSMDSSGEETGGADEGGDIPRDENEKPRIIKKNKLDFRDNWQNVGGLSWVSDCTVDGEVEDMSFQVYGGMRFTKTIAGKGTMRGFWVIGGFSYPGGSDIYHDPEFATKAINLRSNREDGSDDGGAEDEVSSGGNPWVKVSIVVLLLIVIVGAVYFISRSMKKKKEGPKEKVPDEGSWEY